MGCVQKDVLGYLNPLRTIIVFSLCCVQYSCDASSLRDAHQSGTHPTVAQYNTLEATGASVFSSHPFSFRLGYRRIAGYFFCEVFISDVHIFRKMQRHIKALTMDEEEAKAEYNLHNEEVLAHVGADKVRIMCFDPESRAWNGSIYSFRLSFCSRLCHSSSWPRRDCLVANGNDDHDDNNHSSTNHTATTAGCRFFPRWCFELPSAGSAAKPYLAVGMLLFGYLAWPSVSARTLPTLVDNPSCIATFFTKLPTVDAARASHTAAGVLR